jgi:hypothetical protein
MARLKKTKKNKKHLHDAMALLSLTCFLFFFPLVFEINKLSATTIGLFYPLSIASILLYMHGRHSLHFQSIANIAAMTSIILVVTIPTLIVGLYWGLQDFHLAGISLAVGFISCTPLLIIWQFWGNQQAKTLSVARKQ